MRRIFILMMMLVMLPACVLTAEGDPLLSVDDLLSLQDSYDAFLDVLEEMIIERGLLSPEEREAWRSAQMGDFFQNGGYGSILINYMPGVLGYVREEETLAQLSTPVSAGTLYVDTMRRYTPQDTSLSGLMLTISLSDKSGVPLDARYSLTSSSGVFLKWDAITGSYTSVGATTQSDGETVVWSDQTPIEGAKDPTITISIVDTATEEIIDAGVLTLTVDGDGYRVQDGALAAKQ